MDYKVWTLWWVVYKTPLIFKTTKNIEHLKNLLILQIVIYYLLKFVGLHGFFDTQICFLWQLGQEVLSFILAMWFWIFWLIFFFSYLYFISCRISCPHVFHSLSSIYVPSQKWGPFVICLVNITIIKKCDGLIFKY